MPSVAATHGALSKATKPPTPKPVGSGFIADVKEVGKAVRETVAEQRKSNKRIASVVKSLGEDHRALMSAGEPTRSERTYYRERLRQNRQNFVLAEMHSKTTGTPIEDSVRRVRNIQTGASFNRAKEILGKPDARSLSIPNSVRKKANHQAFKDVIRAVDADMKMIGADKTGVYQRPMGRVAETFSRGVVKQLASPAIGGVAKVLGPAGAVIAGVVETKQVIDIGREHGVSSREFSSGTGKAAGTIGGMLGGAAVGAAMGTALIPIPFVGTIAGGVIGGLVGAEVLGKVGGAVGGAVHDAASGAARIGKKLFGGLDLNPFD